MLITLHEFGNLSHECRLYNIEHQTRLAPYDYAKEVYHARIENAHHNHVELIFESPKWETYYLMKRKRVP